MNLYDKLFTIGFMIISGSIGFFAIISAICLFAKCFFGVN